MKTKIAILSVLFCLMSFSVFAQEKSKKELKAERDLQKQNEIEKLIADKKFDFEAQKANPQGGQFIILDYNTYFLKFNPEKITCDLPFFGRAFSVPYGGDGGIKFEGTPENYKMQKKKKSYEIKTSVRGKDDFYNLMLTVFFDGNATLSINSNNRAFISYEGEIKPPKNNESKK